MNTLPELYSPRQIICASHVVDEPAPDADYVGYRVIDPKTIKDKIIDLMGAVLARCWLDKRLMDNLVNDPHSCLLEMGIVMPEDVNLVVRRERKNRPQIIVYENKNRICALQLRMLATR